MKRQPRRELRQAGRNHEAGAIEGPGATLRGLLFARQINLTRTLHAQTLSTVATLRLLLALHTYERALANLGHQLRLRRCVGGLQSFDFSSDNLTAGIAFDPAHAAQRRAVVGDNKSALRRAGKLFCGGHTSRRGNRKGENKASQHRRFHDWWVAASILWNGGSTPVP